MICLDWPAPLLVVNNTLVLPTGSIISDDLHNGLTRWDDRPTELTQWDDLRTDWILLDDPSISWMFWQLLVNDACLLDPTNNYNNIIRPVHHRDQPGMLVPHDPTKLMLKIWIQYNLQLTYLCCALILLQNKPQIAIVDLWKINKICFTYYFSKIENY